jgi:hypothetical protein
MKSASKLAVLLVLGAGLAGCDIGEGSTIEKLEIIPASDATQLKRFEIGDRHKVFQCLRDELLVRATFTDGTEANFAGRASWSSSDPAIVQVSDGDIPAVLTTGSTDGSFFVSTGLTYGKGTVVPVGTPGQTAVITATFAGLSASIEVEIRKPSFRILPVPEEDPDAAAPPYYLAEQTRQRFSVLLDLDGRQLRGADVTGGISNGFNINPFRWVFTGGTFVPQDPDVDDDSDLWVIDAGTDRVATMFSTTTDGFIDGVTADYAPHEVAAELYLCQASADPALLPVADVQVATFYDDPGTPEDDRLILSREAFNGGGFAIEDQVSGTGRRLELRGRLDANGDGSLIVDQNLLGQAGLLVQPVDAACQDDDGLIGCSANSDFVFSSSVLLATSTAGEGDTARIRSCFPVCLRSLATLQADAATVGTGVTVNFTATAINPPAGVTTNYVFDFGDGTTLGPQASALASHAYATAGAYTATVRLVDPAFPAEFLSPNAGAVRVLAGVTVPANNTAPTAVLTVTTPAAAAPATATFTATASTDGDADDSVTVYEFDPGDGTPVIRQSNGVLLHTYLDGTAGPFTPTLTVYDESGVASAPVSAADPVMVTGTTPLLLQSNQFSLKARKATLCSVELQPTPAATPTEPAFSFPGLRFEAVGSFVADTDTDTCTDPPIGTQLITRSVVWAVRPAGVADELSDVVGIRSVAGDYQVAGQTNYSTDVAADTVLDVTATPISPFSSEIVPTPTTLTVTPCTTCTP